MSFTARAAAALTRAGYAVTDSHSGSDGIIVALAIPMQEAQHLAVPNGEEPQELHVTLAYLGKCSDLTAADVPKLSALIERLSASAAGMNPLTVTVGGAGTFEGVGEGGGDACYLNVRAEGLHELRDLAVQACTDSGLPASMKHPEFHPHVTLAYVPRGHAHPGSTLPAVTFSLPDVQLWFGGQHASIPFGGTFAKAEQGPAREDVQKAHEMYAQLTGDLIQIHRQGRQASAQTDAVRAHHDRAAERLGRAIRAPRGSALEDAYLDHAEQARSARVLGDL